jgi:hypothetical protein
MAAYAFGSPGPIVYCNTCSIIEVKNNKNATCPQELKYRILENFIWKGVILLLYYYKLQNRTPIALFPRKFSLSQTRGTDTLPGWNRWYSV